MYRFDVPVFAGFLCAASAPVLSLRATTLVGKDIAKWRWQSERSDYGQSTIVHKEDEYGSWINYVVARSTSGGYRPAISLPCYLAF